MSAVSFAQPAAAGATPLSPCARGGAGGDGGQSAHAPSRAAAAIASPSSAAGAAGAASPSGVTVRVGAVPEHFNIPWAIAQERNLFENVNVAFSFVPGGTGAMVRALQDNTQDVVIALFDGLCLAALTAPASPVRLVGTYVSSPLVWAVAVHPARDDVRTVADLRGKRIGISRHGSGSHTMCFLIAEQCGFDASEFTFVVKNDFAGLRDGIADGSIDAFLWETFMTKPFFDNGTLRKATQIATPWPAFAIAARKDCPSAVLDAFRERVMPAIESASAMFMSDEDDSAQRISRAYGLTVDDAHAWLRTVHFEEKMHCVSAAAIRRTLDVLLASGQIRERPADLVAALVDERVCALMDDDNAADAGRARLR